MPHILMQPDSDARNEYLWRHWIDKAMDAAERGDKPACVSAHVKAALYKHRLSDERRREINTCAGSDYAVEIDRGQK